MPYHCKRCKRKIEQRYGACPECQEIIVNEKIEKHINRKVAKYQNTIEYGISKVKEVANPRFWCTTHEGCFRCSFEKQDNDRCAESKEHRDKKYERWAHHKLQGRAVFCELILDNGLRPDLIVVDKGFIFIEEIVCSEKEQSIIRKKKSYPFPVNVINVR